MITKPQCRILWSLLSGGQREAFINLAGLGAEKSQASFEDVNHLFDLELIARTKNLMDGQEIVVLTENGKKLAKVVKAAIKSQLQVSA